MAGQTIPPVPQTDSKHSKKGWIGVDLDGTLAYYVSGDLKTYGELYIGKPILPMIQRVRGWLDEGRQVKIFTARVAKTECDHIIAAIKQWCLDNIGQELEVTNLKDWHMYELWDDRAVSVEQNTGRYATARAKVRMSWSDHELEFYERHGINVSWSMRMPAFGCCDHLSVQSYDQLPPGAQTAVVRDHNGDFGLTVFCDDCAAKIKGQSGKFEIKEAIQVSKERFLELKKEVEDA